jgi:hypothetical protein
LKTLLEKTERERYDDFRPLPHESEEAFKTVRKELSEDLAALF